MVVLAVVLAFGGGDQYLGSLLAHPWAADVSVLSAPWLALAFLAGWTQREPKRWRKLVDGQKNLVGPVD